MYPLRSPPTLIIPACLHSLLDSYDSQDPVLGTPPRPLKALRSDKRLHSDVSPWRVGSGGSPTSEPGITLP